MTKADAAERNDPSEPVTGVKNRQGDWNVEASQEEALKEEGANGGPGPVAADTGLRFHCDACAMDVTHSVRIRCNVCDELDLCGACFCDGKELKRHKAWHAYRVIERHSYPIFTDDWGADEELLLLEASQLYGLGNWVDIAEHIGSRTKEETRQHYESVYLSAPDLLPPRQAVITVSQDQFTANQKARLAAVRDKSPPPLPAIPSAPTTSIPANHEVAGFMPGRLEFEHEYDQDAENLIKDLEFQAVMEFGGHDQPFPESETVSTAPEQVQDPSQQDPLTTVDALPQSENGPSETPLKEEETDAAEAQPADGNEIENSQDLIMKLALLHSYNNRLTQRIRAKQFLFSRGLVEYKKVSYFSFSSVFCQMNIIMN